MTAGAIGPCRREGGHGQSTVGFCCTAFDGGRGRGGAAYGTGGGCGAGAGFVGQSQHGAGCRSARLAGSAECRAGGGGSIGRGSTAGAVSGVFGVDRLADGDVAHVPGTGRVTDGGGCGGAGELSSGG